MKEYLMLMLLMSGASMADPLDPGSYDRDMDGKLDRFEVQQYEEATGKSANDLRGGMNLEPKNMRPYGPSIDSGEDKIEY